MLRQFIDKYFTKTVPKSEQLADFGVVVTGGLGDFLVTARFVRDLLAPCGGVSFDVYSKNPGVIEWIYRFIPGFRTSLHESLFEGSKKYYRYAFRLNQMVYIESRPVSIAGFFPKRSYDDTFQRYCESISLHLEKLGPIATHHPRLDGTLGRYASYKSKKRYDFLHFMAGIEYGGDRFPIDTAAADSSRHGLTPGHYITVHTGFDEAMSSNGRFATKVYPGWSDVVDKLREAGISKKIVQIGKSSTSTRIQNVDVSLIDQTSLQEAASIIAGASLHMDNEGGFVHIASCLGVKSCVVFGPTSLEYFSYPSNLNIGPKECGDCWWIEPTWMLGCPRGLTTPACMESHSSEEIASAILSMFKDLEAISVCRQ